MPELIAMLASVILMKITAMVIGYKIVKLGYDALLRGIKGEFDFGGRVSGGVEFKLLSASPGLFFVLLGSIVIIWSLAVDKPVAFSLNPAASQSSGSSIQPEPVEQKKR